MKKYINLTCALIVFLSTTSFQNGDILCDSKTLKEKAKSALGPYKYDSSELTRIIYKKTETVKEIEIPLFIGEKEGQKFYIAPIRGKGLWDAIWAYVAMDKDMVVLGAYFDHKGETPGLGANIKERFFMDDFVGEHLMSNGIFKGITVSKSNGDPKNEDKKDNEVDAIAGSTITGDGVTAMLRSELQLYVPYFKNLKN